MSKQDELLEYIKSRNGTVTTSDVVAAGFRKELLRKLINAGQLEKEARGIYALPDRMVDSYYLLQQRCQKGIFSYGTALYFHDLSDRTPNVLHLTVPQGYGTAFLKRDFPNTEFHYVYNEVFELGLENVTTPSGHTVRVYNKERCICDLLRAKRSAKRGVDQQLFSGALSGYFRSKDKNLRRLTAYAEVFGVREDLDRYMEVFLPW